MFISEFRVWVFTALEQYNNAKKLIEASKNDPPNEPYRSKYEAREILLQLSTEIDKKWKSNDTSLQVKLLSALLKYEIGVISKETEEYGTGCELFTSTWEEIRDIAGKPECVHLAISILNQLGLLWCDRGEVQIALEYLLEAEDIYNKYKITNETCPFSFEDIFSMEKGTNQDWSAFEKTFTLTLYYMAQVHEHLNNNTKSAEYCRMTLKRQLDSGDFETNDWAINCATLSQYFIQEKMFAEARHLLSCAAFTLLRYEIKVDKNIEENREAWDEVHHSKASLSCCWIKYAINLLAEPVSSKEDNQEEFSCLIEDEEVLMMEKRIPCVITNYAEAKTLFLFAQNHVTVAQSYYTLNEYANNYAQIVQDHSKLYRGLLLHDADLSRQCKMHKRRLDMLEKLLSQLNPQYYLSTCRMLQFELGETCSEMMDLKIKIANATKEGLSIKAAKKVNSLITKGISHFKDFVNFLKDRDGKLPEVFSDDLVRPALIAHFYIGRFYLKLVESDTDVKLHNLSLSKDYHKFIVKYVEENPDHAQHVEVELPLIKEMLELMPEKVIQLLDTAMH